jgi:photosystem II stability/assembly factor-like uncharacterized protein
MSKLLIAVSLAFTVSVVHAQTVEWLPAVGPHSIAAVGVAPNGDYYVSASIYLYHSTDQGATWTAKVVNGGGEIHFTQAGMLVGGFFTADGGKTWSRAKNAPYDPLFEDPAHTNLYGVLPTQTGNQVMRSADGGQTWSVVVASNVMDSVHLCGVASDQTLYGIRKNRGLMRFQNGVWTGVKSEQTWADGVFEVAPGKLICIAGEFIARSYDNGVTWSSWDTTKENGMRSNIGSRGTYLHLDSTRFLLCNGLIYFSDDTGHTISQWGGVHGTSVGLIGITRKRPYSAIIADYDHVWQLGSSQPILGSFPSSDYFTIYDFAISKWGTMYALSSAYDPVAPSSIFESGDDGSSWKQLTLNYRNVDLRGTSITIDSEGYRYVSTQGDYGTPTFYRVNPDGLVDSLPLSNIKQCVAYVDGSLLARTISGWYHSTDRGNSWLQLSWPKQFIISCTDGAGRVFCYDTIGTSVHNLYRFDNLAASSDQILPEFADRFASDRWHSDISPMLAVSPSGMLVIAIDSAGIFTSNDQGNTWVRKGADTTEIYWGLGVDKNGVIYWTNSQSMQSSTNNGNSWVQSKTAWFRYIVSSPSGSVFGWQHDGGVGRGILRAISPQVHSAVTISSNKATASRAYPNPFSKLSHLQFRAAKSGLITIVLTNTMGQQVWNEARMVDAGMEEISVDGSRLMAGPYFYRVDGEGISVAGSVVVER